MLLERWYCLSDKFCDVFDFSFDLLLLDNFKEVLVHFEQNTIGLTHGREFFWLTFEAIECANNAASLK
jgi:hypothetical protein